MSVQEFAQFQNKQFSEWDAPVVSLKDRNRVWDFLQEVRPDRLEDRSGLVGRSKRDRNSLQLSRVQAHYGLGSRLKNSGLNVAAEVRGCLCPGQHVAR